MDNGGDMDTASVELQAPTIEAIARRVAELLAATDAAPARLADAAAVAEALGVDREWVYAHANDLGAIRLGGPHGRLRFDLQVVRERLGDTPAATWRPPKRAARRQAQGAQKTGKGPLERKLKSNPSRKSGRGARQTPPA
jgi:hypothetical protein